MDSPADIRFDGWTLRRRSGELLKDGVVVRLQEQPLRILEELLARPGEVVTREELIARLWPKGIVEFDTALNSAVRRLRRTLGDEAETPRFIETLPKRGYRFIGTVDGAERPAAPPVAAQVSPPAQDPPPASEPAPDARAPWRRRRLAIAATALLALGVGAATWLAIGYRNVPPAAPTARAAPGPSIAVLPFVDMSAEQDQQYFSDGLAEELIHLLAQTPQLQVIARTSSFSFRGDAADIATIAKQLTVTHVLEGSVRKAGERVRITAQLIDTATSAHLWSRTYDRELDDVLEVQSDIARSVANAVQVALAEGGRPGATADPRAHELRLRANFLLHRRAPGDVERAADYYRQAVELDPNFARAWAGLASAHWILVTQGAIERDAGLEMQREAAERALALDARLAEAHLRLALYHWMRGDRAQAREHREAAAAAEPDHPLVVTLGAGNAAYDGRFDPAVELMQRAVALDPLNLTQRYNLSVYLLLGGRLEEAKAESLATHELGHPNPPAIAGQVLVLQRRFEEARALAEGWPDGAERRHVRALAYFGLGRRAEADAALASLVEMAGQTEPALIAEVYAWRGERDAAFAWLEKAVRPSADVREMQLARRDAGWIRHSPFLTSLRADPRWAAWLAAVLRD